MMICNGKSMLKEHANRSVIEHFCSEHAVLSIPCMYQETAAAETADANNNSNEAGPADNGEVNQKEQNNAEPV